MSSTYQSYKDSISQECLTLSHDIREFIDRCRSEQTLFVNLEGQFERRCFKRNEEDSLKNYVSETMSINEHPGYDLDDFAPSPERLANKILKFTSQGSDVYCSNFWLHYYKYEDKSTHSIPLFKIFKGKETDDFFIFDTNMVFYNSFEDFLNTIKLPLSFICVPRDGKYVFVQDRLSLEFICSNKHDNAVRDFPPFTPFSQRIYRWISDGWDPAREFLLYIAESAFAVFNASNLNLGSILILLNRIEKYFSQSTSSSKNEFYNECLMLCDVKKEAFGAENPPMESTERTETVRSLWNLLKNPEGNWREIIRNTCELMLLIPDHLPLMGIFGASPNPLFLKIVIGIVTLKLLARAGLWIVDNTETKPLTGTHTSRQLKFSGNDVQFKKNCLRTINYETALKNLSKLSSMPASKFEDLYTEQPTRTTETHVEVLSPADGFNFLGVEDGAAFFIIARASPAHINYYADILSAFIKPDGPNRSKIIKETKKDKKEIGALHYVSDFVVVGYIEEEELPEGVNVRDRLKRTNKGLSGLSF